MTDVQCIDGLDNFDIFSDADITTIVDKHNELRKDPKESISAAEMLLMVSYLKY